MLREIRERARELLGEILKIALERVVAHEPPRGTILARDPHAHTIETRARARERRAQTGVGLKSLHRAQLPRDSEQRVRTRDDETRTVRERVVAREKGKHVLSAGISLCVLREV